MVSCLAMAHKAPQHSAMVACTVNSNIEQCYDINKMRLEQCYDINSALRAQHSDIALAGPGPHGFLWFCGVFGLFCWVFVCVCVWCLWCV